MVELDQVIPDRIFDQIDAALLVQFAQNALAVAVNGLDAENQSIGYLAVGQVFSKNSDLRMRTLTRAA